MSNILQSAFLKAAEENSGSGSHCVSGCMYQVVQTIGTDGKNLLQLLPVSKSSGNLTPVVQSPVVSDDLKGNTGKPDQVTFQTQISSSSASAPVQLHIFQPANDTKYFHTRTVDTPGKGRVTSVGTGSLTPPVSNVESLVKTDGLTMQRFAIPPSTQNYSSYFVVNTPSLPVNMNSSVSPSGHPLQIPVNMNSSILPSGYRLQIPACAEVKTTPATTLSPLVHQMIRGTATTSTSGTVEASQIPSVFDVSPVNSVQNRVAENLQNIYPKQVTINTSKIPLNDATQTQLKGGQHSQGTQVKWNFQENLQPGIPSRFPVTLSNNMASKILNTVIGRKIMGDNIKSTPLLSTVSSQRTHYIYVPVKHALVMLNGKVYLMTKKRLLSQYDQQNSVSSDIPLRKDCSQVVSSSPDTEIPKEVNSPLIKSKSLQLETKSLSNSQLASMASLTAEKDEKVERPSFSVTDSHTVNQSHNCLKQSQTVFTNPVFPDGFRTEQNAPREGNLIQGIEKICSSVDAATVTSQQCVFRDQESQTQYAMASMLKKETQEGNNKYSQGSNTKTSYLKSDDEFKKLFGLTKDLRVCLTRIPDHLCSRKGFDSFTNMVKNNSYRDADIVMKEEVKQHSFPKKRKAKTIKKTDYTKRRKIKRASDAVMNGTDEASSQLLSILPTPDLPQHNIVTSTASEDKRTELENCSHEKQEKDALSSSTSCEQSSYFNRSYTEDIFIVTPPELEETIRDEKIRRLKQNLREKEAALEEMRKKMHQKQ